MAGEIEANVWEIGGKMLAKSGRVQILHSKQI
jgi:hypothetical protein